MRRILWFMGAITSFFHSRELLELFLPWVTTSMDRGAHMDHLWMGILFPIHFLGILDVPEIIIVVLDELFFTLLPT
jgi:hypothetical protein